MIRQKVENSSNIAEVGYLHETMTLEVKFHSGDIYQYWPVTEVGYKTLMKSESKGKFFYENIRKNQLINFKKIEEIQG